MKLSELYKDSIRNDANANNLSEVENVPVVAKRESSRHPRKKNPFTLVNERYSRSLPRQVSQSKETKRTVADRAISETVGITLNMYLSILRDIIFRKLLANIMFQCDCVELGLDPFAAAQNIAMAGSKQVDLVLNLGVGVVYKDNTEVLKDEIYTELEMAKARFSSLTGSPSEWQLTEAKKLTNAVSQVLGLMEKQS